MYAARAWWLLRWLGHDAVALLDGGLQAWEAAGQPLTQDAPAQNTGDFKAGAPLSVTVDAQTVERNLGSKERVVVDARAADRYRGENETLDRVGGHIPGALNRFFKDNLTADGRFKSGSHVARGIPCAARRHAAGACGAAMRLGRDGMRERSGDGGRRPAWRGVVCGIVERMEFRSEAAGCNGPESLSDATPQHAEKRPLPPTSGNGLFYRKRKRERRRRQRLKPPHAA